jgi:hypothetical protein
VARSAVGDRTDHTFLAAVSMALTSSLGRCCRLRRPLIAAIAKLVAAKPDNQYKIREIDGGEQD